MLMNARPSVSPRFLIAGLIGVVLLLLIAYMAFGSSPIAKVFAPTLTPTPTPQPLGDKIVTNVAEHFTDIVVAIIGLSGTLGAAYLIRKGRSQPKAKENKKRSQADKRKIAKRDH